MHYKKINSNRFIQTQRAKTYIIKHFKITLLKSFPTVILNELNFKNNPNTSKSRLKTVCTLSGLERSSNLTKFNVSRHFFRKKMVHLTFSGIRKASW